MTYIGKPPATSGKRSTGRRKELKDRKEKQEGQEREARKIRGKRRKKSPPKEPHREKTHGNPPSQTVPGSSLSRRCRHP
jgi:hypothetical protein